MEETKGRVELNHFLKNIWKVSLLQDWVTEPKTYMKTNQNSIVTWNWRHKCFYFSDGSGIPFLVECRKHSAYWYGNFVILKEANWLILKALLSRINHEMKCTGKSFPSPKAGLRLFWSLTCLSNFSRLHKGWPHAQQIFSPSQNSSRVPQGPITGRQLITEDI